MPSPAVLPTPGMHRDIEERLFAILQDLSGEPIGDAQRDTGFLDLGFDSLFLAQFVGGIDGAFGITVTFRQMLDDLSTVEAVAAHIAARQPARAPAPPPAAPATVAVTAPVAATATVAATAPVAATAATVTAVSAAAPFAGRHGPAPRGRPRRLRPAGTSWRSSSPPCRRWCRSSCSCSAAPRPPPRRRFRRRPHRGRCRAGIPPAAMLGRGRLARHRRERPPPGLCHWQADVGPGADVPPSAPSSTTCRPATGPGHRARKPLPRPIAPCWPTRGPRRVSAANGRRSSIPSCARARKGRRSGTSMGTATSTSSTVTARPSSATRPPW